MIVRGDGLESRWQWWLRLVASAIVVFGLHAGLVAYAYLQPPAEEAIEEPEGAFMMELAPLPVAAASDAAEAPGPPAEATLPPVAEKTPTETTPEVTPPKEDPLPVAPEPELAMPMPTPVEEPKEEKEEEKPVEKQVVKEEEKKEEKEPELEKAKAQEAMVKSAPVTPSVASDQNTAARRQGITERKSDQAMSWAKALISHLGKNRRGYPVAASRAGQQGEVQVAFKIDRQGQVLSVRVVKSSKSAPLDDEALAMVRRAAPLPVPPDEVGGESFEFVMPIQFTIK